MAARLEDESGVKLRAVKTPFLSSDRWGEENETPGKYASSCASHAASSLFASRVARPDLSESTRRLCTAVSRWTVIDDDALVRLMSYVKSHADYVIFGTLSPSDLEDLEIHVYSDADWAGDLATSRSTTGVWVELASRKSGNTWPISWSSSRQTSTSSSTAEAETVAASHAMRREAIPAQLLLEECLGVRLHIEHFIDNMQAISAIRKGYSKKLRHLRRTQRVAIGLLNDSINDPELDMSVSHQKTDGMKADLFTKALEILKFDAARSMIRLGPKV